MIIAAVLLLATAAGAHAWRVPASAPLQPPCPPIPDAYDLHLTSDERTRIDAGEIVLRVLQRGDRGGLAQAVGYLHANPVWLFDVATDSSLADGMADVIRDVRLLDVRPGGKLVHGVARPSAWLPSFQYTISVSYLEDDTGQCWAETEGDFAVNEGSHAYLWDPLRNETLAVFTFKLELKGLLSILPESLLARLTARTLPSYMRSLDASAARLAREDPPRAARVEARWRELQPRLESNPLAGRVWLDGPPALSSASFRQGSAAGDGGR